MIIAHNGTCSNHCNVTTDIRIAKETGYGGIEVIGSKLYRYLDQGFTTEDLLGQLDGFPVVGLGFVQDIERYKPDDFAELERETEKMCSVAAAINCNMVQLLTGPIDPGLGLPVADCYRDIMEMSWPELRKITAKNLQGLSKIAAHHHVNLYLEALSWAPTHTLGQMLELIQEAGCDNIGILLDFWHLYTSDTTPDEVAKLDKNMILGVQFCDSARGDGGSHADRHVWTGGGVIPLKYWVDAVLATGFDGWWACELFSPTHLEMDPWETARLLKDTLRFLLPGRIDFSH